MLHRNWVVQRRVPAGREFWPFLTGVAVAAIVCVDHADAQLAPTTPTHIAGRTSCASCRMRIEHVWKIAAETGPASLRGQPRNVVRDSRGQVYVLADVVPQVFDANGKFVRTMGKIGGGPGEFQAPWLTAVGRGDTVTFLDLGLSRLAVFDRDGRFVRTTPMLPTGRLWVGAFLASGDLVGVGSVGGVAPTIPIHVVGSNGRLVRSFGAVAGDASRTIAVDGRGTIWAIHRYRHQLDNFDSTGVLLASYAIDAEWFPAARAPNWQAMNDRDPPPPYSRAIVVDPAGLVWLFTYVARSDWNRGLRPMGGGRAGFQFTAHRAYDTRVEVFDPVSRTLLASQTVPHFIIHGLIGGYAAAYEETEAGVPTLSIMRLTLTR